MEVDIAHRLKAIPGQQEQRERPCYGYLTKDELPFKQMESVTLRTQCRRHAAYHRKRHD